MVAVELKDARFDPDGFTVIPGVLDRVAARDLEEYILYLATALNVAPSGTWFEGQRTIRIHNLLARTERFDDVLQSRSVVHAVRSILGPEFLLSSIAAVIVLPGETDQVIHVDDSAIDLPRPHSSLECTMMLALSEFSRANGATRVVPGSHRWLNAPALRASSPRHHPDQVAVELPPGSAVLYHGGLWHGAGANDTRSPRVAVGASFCRSWLRQHENPYLGLDPERVAALPDPLQSMLGYAIASGVVNHVEGLQPLDYLRQIGRIV